eukprot:TRINITY_DN6572_c0_g1_i1.p1 TRINITY_DN6572_c0_g1~~TRINITY_DN6572_c0_g1_i1.p1  ORF type:complete len:2609 (-),score=102.52 TRINITY_DN6572_c0_g1_i1:818-8608(-)
MRVINIAGVKSCFRYQFKVYNNGYRNSLRVFLFVYSHFLIHVTFFLYANSVKDAVLLNISLPVEGSNSKFNRGTPALIKLFLIEKKLHAQTMRIYRFPAVLIFLICVVQAKSGSSYVKNVEETSMMKLLGINLMRLGKFLKSLDTGFKNNSKISLLFIVVLFWIMFKSWRFARNRRVALVSIILLTLTFPLSTIGATEESWTYTGATQTSSGQGLTITPTGEYLITGYTDSKGEGGLDLWLLKYNQNLSVLWDRTFGGGSYDKGYGIQTLDNGNIVVCGSTKSKGEGGYDGWVLLLDSSGNLVWDKTYGGSNDDVLYRIRVASTGGFVATGYTRSKGAGYADVWLIRITSEGALQWDKTFGGGGNDYAVSVVETPDQGFAAAGYSGSMLLNGLDGYVVKVDSAGNLGWEKYIGGLLDEYLYDIAATSDGKLLVVGFNGLTPDIWALKLSSTGAIIWEKNYGTTLNEDKGYAVTAMYDGGFLLAGTTSDLLLPTQGYIIRLNSAGNLLWSKQVGGAGSEVLWGIAMSPDGGYCVVGDTTSYSAASSSIYVITGFAACPPGTYMYESVCINCAAGKHNPLGSSFSSASCVNCAAGSYSGSGQALCTLCTPGTYQEFAGKTSCVLCGIGTVNADLGSTSVASCITCEEGFYQPAEGQATCLSCSNPWKANAEKTACLYKGIFATQAEFDSSSMKSACFPEGTLVKPFTEPCRNAYRQLCCIGSSTIPGVDCNFALELNSSNPLYSKYCSACAFMEQSNCPVQGACWDDSLFVDNTYNPYSAFSVQCLEEIGSYCGNKLEVDSNDGECYMFSADCANPSVTESTYGENWDKFRITLNRKLPNSLPVAPIFAAEYNMEEATLTRLSDFEIEVEVSGLDKPPLQYKLLSGTLLNICQVPFPSTFVYNVFQCHMDFLIDCSAHYCSGDCQYSRCHKQSEQVLALYDYIRNNCIAFPYSNQQIQKPYPWTINYSWSATYSSPIPPTSTERLSLLAIYSDTTSAITISPEDLYSDNALTVQLTIETPFSATVTSNTLSITPVSPNGKVFPCSPCQFTSRAICEALNGICWDDYLSYSEIYSLLSSQNCINAVAEECYIIWSTNGPHDPQCADFEFFLDFTKMKTQPHIISAKYIAEESFKLLIKFDVPIRNKYLGTCQSILADSMMEWLYNGIRNPVCIWRNQTTLEIVHDTTYGLLPYVQLKESVAFFDYNFSQIAAATDLVSITLPDLSGTVSLEGPFAISSCSDLILSVVTKNPGAIHYKFSWNFSYVNIELEAQEEEEINVYFDQFEVFGDTKIVVIPSKYLIDGGILQSTVSVKAIELNNLTLSCSRNITITPNAPTVRYGYKSSPVLELRGDLLNKLDITINADPCSSSSDNATPSPANITFSVYSGDDYTKEILNRNQTELAIESILYENYAQHRTILVSLEQLFEYTKYYNITTCVHGRLVACDSIVVLIAKPPIKVTISGTENVAGLTRDVLLSSAKSELPESEGAAITYSWRCVKCYSYVSASACNCPRIDYYSYSQETLVLPAASLNEKSRYVFGLTIIASEENYIRTAYGEAEFVTVKDNINFVTGYIIHGKTNDIYFTFDVEYKGKDSDLSFEWELLEVRSLLPGESTYYSKLNTFFVEFFRQSGISLNSTSAQNDTDIPDFLRPTELTSNKVRILGIDKTKLRSRHKYVYAVTIKSPDSPSFSIVSITTPIYPQPRNIEIFPKNGTAFKDMFIIKHSAKDSNLDASLQYQIFRKDCGDSEAVAISPVLGTSNIYRTILVPGSPTCQHRVEIIIKATYEEESVYSSKAVIVMPAEDPPTIVIKKGLENLAKASSVTADEILSIVAALAQFEDKEETEVGKKNVHGMINLIDNVTSAKSEMVWRDHEKVLRYNLTAATLGEICKHHKVNIECVHCEKMLEMLISWVSLIQYEEDSPHMVPTVLDTISALSEITVEKSFTKHFKRMSNLIDSIVEIKRRTIQPDAPNFIAITPMLSVYVIKQYEDNFDKGGYYRGNNENSISLRLPPGLMVKIKENIPELNELKTIITVSTVIIAVRFNPYSTVRNNTDIEASSLTGHSYNSKLIRREVVQDIYKDLSNGNLNITCSDIGPKTHLVTTSFHASTIEKDSLIREFPQNITIGTLPDSKTVDFEFPYCASHNSSSSNVDDIIVPVYYFPENNSWTNANCSLTNKSESYLYVESKQLGRPDSKASNLMGKTIALTVDIIPNTMELIKSGNYEMLYTFEPLKTFTFKNALVVIVTVLILTGLLSTTIWIAAKDRAGYYNARVETLSSIIESPKPLEPENFMEKILQTIGRIKSKGISGAAGDTTAIIYPELDSSYSSQCDNTNGFNTFSEKEKEELRELYEIYKDRKEACTPLQLQNLLAGVLAQNKILQRRTKAHLEEKSIHGSTFKLLLLMHEIYQALCVLDLKTPRTMKLLVLALIFMGETALSGYFFSPEEDLWFSFDPSGFLKVSIASALTATLVMLPIKLTIEFFLSGVDLDESMSRAEIENKEKWEPILKKVGYVLACVWLLFCAYAITMFSLNFAGSTLDMWIASVLIGVFIEYALLETVKILLKLLVGYILVKLLDSGRERALTGVIVGRIVRFIVWLI